MKTVSTKLDSKLHNRFVEICNEEGKCQSEFLRDMIEMACEADSEDIESKPTAEIKVPTVEIIYD